MDEAELLLDHCVCAHCIPVVLEQVVQYLLYERRQIPLPLVTLVDVHGHEPDITENQAAAVVDRVTHRRELAMVKQFRRLQAALNAAFTSGNAGLIEEALIVFGATPFAPRDVYSIACAHCRTANDAQNATCYRLSQREVSMLARKLFVAQFASAFPAIPATNAYVLLRADRRATMPVEFVPKMSFSVRGTRHNAGTVRLVCGQCAATSEADAIPPTDVGIEAAVADLGKLTLHDQAVNAGSSESTLWFQFDTAFVGFN